MRPLSFRYRNRPIGTCSIGRSIPSFFSFRKLMTVCAGFAPLIFFCRMSLAKSFTISRLASVVMAGMRYALAGYSQCALIRWLDRDHTVQARERELIMKCCTHAKFAFPPRRKLRTTTVNLRQPESEATRWVVGLCHFTAIMISTHWRRKKSLGV